MMAMHGTHMMLKPYNAIYNFEHLTVGSRDQAAEGGGGGQVPPLDPPLLKSIQVRKYIVS